MITGAHVILYSKDPAADREFLKGLLGHIDAGEGWLIFRLPPAELAVHPTEGAPQQELYLMCDNLDETVRQLTEKGAEADGEATTAAWGTRVSIRLPSGSVLPLYQPRHPPAHG
ncbi:extradiol dioxygenase [Amycolatopsis sp. FU40]|uniref:VOC family protein n=1 Tax=Amycolatopsis sp. FU40 TaxID=2914159 RepID=UPI001F1B604F|nr:extradiol dioxygenase [Amycolatopsis sp. FU40]UKD55516.1 extradiol dioxygenase [Amycolatopsis sp. FU40]